jgi:hypothetical protein
MKSFLTELPKALKESQNQDNNLRSWAADFKNLTFAQFWEAIGNPIKNGREHPIYPYELQVYGALQEYKYIWIKKATGLGITEFFLRYMAWLALKDDAYRGQMFGIVTGPNEKLAKELVDRIVQFFHDSPPEHTATEVVLNGCKIQAFPSNHLDAMRGRPNLKFILLDEADFFRIGEQKNARDVSERYIAKTDPIIAMVSTPNMPGGLFEKIESEDKSIYHRIFLPYTRGEGGIYTPEQIAEARKSPSFEREYNLKYGFGIGNIWLPEQIEACMSIPYSPEEPGKRAVYSLGIDPAFGSSKFAFVASRLLHGIVEIIYAEEFEKADFGEMVRKAVQLMNEHGIDKVFVDGSDPAYVRALKKLVGERVDYDDAMEDAKRQKLDYERLMKIVPIYFRGNSLGEKNSMITHAQELVADGNVAIDKRFNKLITQMRIATTNEKGAVEKEAGNTLDLIDAFFLSLRRYHY